MSTEDPAKPGLVRSPIEQVTEIGGVRLGAGMLLNLGPEDYFFGEDWTDQSPVLLEITRVGQVLRDGDHVYVEGYEHVGTQTRARGLAVRIKSLPDALVGHRQ